MKDKNEPPLEFYVPYCILCSLLPKKGEEVVCFSPDWREDWFLFHKTCLGKSSDKEAEELIRQFVS